MKTFEEALKDEIIRRTSVMESEGWDKSSDPQALMAFESGANWASTNPELINEILMKYHEWAINTPSKTFKKWEDEEGGFDKTKTRIRKEFIEFLKREG